MPTEIKLPRLGQGMDEGKILRWLKQEGDTVTKGDEIYEVETEKVNIEVEAPADGTLLKIVVGEGTEVPIGTVLGYLGAEDEEVPSGNGSARAAEDAPSARAQDDAGDEKPASDGAKPHPEAPPADPKDERFRDRAAEQQPTPAQAARSVGGPSGTETKRADAQTADGDARGRVKASPLARRIARDRGIDLSSMQGSGPDGRIIARDLERAEALEAGTATAAPATAAAATGDAGERVELSSMRRTIARRLSEAWQAPAFYLTVDIDMQRANELRRKLVDTMAEDDVKPTVSDIVTKACAVALRRHPDMNVHVAGDALVRFSEVHIGIAVATEQGLVVPVLRQAHARSVREIAVQRSVVVGKARNGKLTAGDMEGGTFTISNLGMMGIDEFTAVLNPPMAGILAVGRTRDSVVAVNGRPEVRPQMTVTLGCDHRAVDGAVGARFLAELKGCLEEPLTMI